MYCPKPKQEFQFRTQSCRYKYQPCFAYHTSLTQPQNEMIFTFFIWVPYCFHLFSLSVFLILSYWSAAHSSLLYLNINWFLPLPENTSLCWLLLDVIWLVSPWRPLQFTYNPWLQSTYNCPQVSVIEKSQVPCFCSIMKVLIKVLKRSGHKSRLW